MPDLVCDTSPIQYLYQLGLFDLLRQLGGRVLVPPAVRDELLVGRSRGIDLPDLDGTPWIGVCPARGSMDVRLVSDMGAGEAEVMMLALENPDWIAVLDDFLARQRAALLGIRFTGTLGLLLDAKTRGMVDRVVPLLDKLDALGFRLATHTRRLILEAAGEG